MAHLDLKPDNFVITDDFKLALIDFCHSDLLNKSMTTITGTTSYQAPEIRSYDDNKSSKCATYNA
jgi:serine/threonine protein kinase